MGKYAILDTNIFLHYDVLNIDWCKELESNEVEIIVCSTVLRELDKKKYDDSQKISGRATKNLSMIESLNSSKEELRKNVKLSVSIKEPYIDWKYYGLDSSLNDDRILGFVIKRENADDVLITNDSTLRIKCREIGMSVLKLSCKMLPDPKSEERKELERMKTQMQKLQNKIPDLSIQLHSEETKDDPPKFTIKVVQDLSTGQIEEMASKKEQGLNITSSPPASNILTFTIDIPALMINIPEYQSDVKKYLDSYKTYLAAKNRTEQELSTALKMDFALSCKRAPAEDVYCCIEFPQGFEIFKQSNLPEMPSEPVPPKPRTPLKKILDRKPTSMLLPYNFPSLVSPIPENNVNVDFNSNVIEVKIKKINHGFRIPFGVAYVKIPSLKDAKNFEISYTIHASNLAEPKQAKIPVIIEKIE